MLNGILLPFCVYKYVILRTVIFAYKNFVTYILKEIQW